MHVRTLAALAQADLSNEVVHFTGRRGPNNDQVGNEILALDGPARLARIIETRRVDAFRPFHGYGDPVICFTEATLSGLQRLVAQLRYHPWGLSFRKDWVFRRGGGPAHYVRGDLWDEYCEVLAGSPEILAFATKYWPGVDLEPGEDASEISNALLHRNEWAHEREWRVPRPDPEPFITFAYADVASLIVPAPQFGPWLKEKAAGALDDTPVVLLPSPDMNWVLGDG